MNITLRAVKGTALSHAEMDENFTELASDAVDHTASATLSASSIGKSHIVEHATNAIALTLPKGTDAMKGKRTMLCKWGAGDAAFVFNAGDTIADSSPGATLQNTIAGEAKIAKTEIAYIGSDRWMIVSDIGSWATV